MSNKPSRAYYTKKVLLRRYGRLLYWRKPVIHNIRGPYHPDFFDRFALDLALSIQISKDTFEDLTDEEFFARFDYRGEVIHQAHMMTERLTLAELKVVFQQEPAWFAGGFGVEGRKADDQHWARMQRWSLDEAVALSIGYEPCGDLLERADGMPVQSDVLAYYLKRHALIEDNFDWGSEKAPLKNRVGDVVRWFHHSELDVPPSLLAATDKYHALGLGKKTKPGRFSTADDKPLDPRERSTMLKLIITMAMKGYGYDPRAERSPTPTDIESDMNEFGIRINLETIRKHLRSGADMLDDEVLEGLYASEQNKEE
jgi:hypothetical protein